MKAEAIRRMTVEEVEQELQDAREELWRLQFRSATEELENPMLIRERRRDVARLRTILEEHRNPNHPTALAGGGGGETS